MPLNWFDIALIVVILWSAIAGLRAGFARVVVGLAATLAGLIAGFWFYRLVAAKLAPFVRTPAIADLLGFFAIFLGVMILGALLAAMLARFFHWIGLSWIDHLLGGAAGLVRGILVIAAFVAVLVAYAPSPMPRFIESSRVLPYVSEVSLWLSDLAPHELKEAVREQMENLEELWRRAREKGSLPV